ncbi:MAG TPA: hypothetical protein VN950_27125 [Terriglobales bacterium]|nr:hypothetical protein [Terriglobales bacterium]
MFRNCQLFHVTPLVDGLPVLIRSRVGGEIDGLVADVAAYS